MPHHPPKKQKLESAVVAGNDFSPSFDDLVDVLPNILGCLTLQDVMCQRRLNKKTMEAVKKTIVPPSDFRVSGVESCNAMNLMTTEMPNLQLIEIGSLGERHKYSDGEDPDERVAAETADYITLNIEIVSSFRKLLILKISSIESLNGRYPFLFSSFPLLQKLSITWCRYLKWDLEMLAGLPVLKELDCIQNECLTGNINSLRVLKNSLEKVIITCCPNVEGNFMDLADFPHLKEFDLEKTAVTGAIRDIGEDDFPSLEHLILPKGGNCGKDYIAMRAMTTAIPNLQQITLRGLGGGHKWSDGDYPDEVLAAQTADYTSHDIDLISNFRNLRILCIKSAGLNGRHHFLFNSFPLLQKLSIKDCDHLKWDLDMLVGLPLLKELECSDNRFMTGNVNSLRVLKETLEKVKIYNCQDVEGNFMDLADFPRLKELELEHTNVTGDIRDIGGNDFSSLEYLNLPKGVYGGDGYEFQRISDAANVVRAVYLLKKKIPALDIKYWHGKLSQDSPDWYDGYYDNDTPPLSIRFVEAGPRIGYRWSTSTGIPCEVNWLDPEPDRDSSDYDELMVKSRQAETYVTIYTGTYRGFYQPPTEEEYRRLFD